MFGLSLSHLVVLFIVILLFGSRRLPELGSSLGRTIHAFKRGLEGKGDEKNEEIAQKGTGPKNRA